MAAGADARTCATAARSRRAGRRLAGVSILLALASGAAGACDAGASRVGPGGECFLAVDCAPGLVCLEQANKTRVCSDDISKVAGRGPAEAGGEDAAEGEGGDAEPSEDASPPDVVTPPRDTGTPDTSGPADTGPSQG